MPALENTVFVARAIRVTLLILVLLLAGCAATGGAAPATTTVPAEQTAATLVLWYGWSGGAQQALLRLVDTFNKEHPTIRVFPQQMPIASLGGDLRAAVQAGSGPHMVLLPSGWLGGLVADDVLLPLDPLLDANQQRSMLPVAIGSAQTQDADGARHLYGQPITVDTLALFYNKANVLAAPATTADLFNLARGLSEPSASPPRWGFALSLSVETTIGYLYAFDGRLFDDQGALVLGNSGRAGTERWLDWTAALNADQRLLARPYSSVEVDRELKNNQALMTFGWAHQLGEYRQLWGEQFGVAPLPKLAETNRLPQPYAQSDVVAINARATSGDQGAAAEFLRYLASDQAQRELLGAGLQPASGTLDLNGEGGLLEAARVFRQQAGSAQPLPNGTDRTVLREEVWQMQRVVLEGRTNPSDAVSEADTRLREALKR